MFQHRGPQSYLVKLYFRGIIIFGDTFYHGHVKRYVTLFGTLFNDLWIVRKDNDGRPKQSMKVPLAYGPREKFLARLESNPDLEAPNGAIAIIVPRISFEITGINYDPERKLPAITKFIKKDFSDNNSSIKKYLFNPVPYDINFALSVYSKNAEDATMIVEQILPFFTPDFTTTIKVIDDPEIVLDIPLILNSVNQDDVYDGSFEERRALIWSFDFTMKTLFFGPVKRQGIIKLANVNFFDATLFDTMTEAVDDAERVDNITIYPGLTANGLPSTDPANTIHYSSISSTDDWDYIVDISGIILANT